jgi:hypothetical protein
MRSAGWHAALLGAIFCLGLLPAAQAADAPTKAPARTDTPVSAATASANDAAAKHVKRTACLKDARAKKLVGAEKTAYVKNCVAAP